MKHPILKMAFALLIITGALSCKEKETEENPSEAKLESPNTVLSTNYTVDIEKSVIHWKGSKPGKDHTGTLKLSSGALEAIDRDLQSGNFVIDMNTIDNTDLEGQGKENLEAHLKGTVEGKEKDFFNVTEFPTASFELKSVSGTGGNITVKGDLTIKNIKQPIEFPAVVSFPGRTVFLKSKPFTIDRTKWEVNFMSKSIFDDLKDKFISDEIELTIELYGTKS